MSTRIPPHNFREVIDACIRLIDNPDATAAGLAKNQRAGLSDGGVLLDEADEIKVSMRKDKAPSNSRVLEP